MTHRINLSTKEEAVATLLSEGVEDAEVCRRLAMEPESLDVVLQRLAATASDVRTSMRSVALCERALRRRADLKIRSMGQLIHAMFEIASEGVLVVTGSDGRIRDCNEAATRIFGRRRSQLTQLTVEAFLPAPMRGTHSARRLEFLEVGRRGGFASHPPATIRRPNGTDSDLAISVFVTSASDDVLVVCSDVRRWAVTEHVAIEFGSQRD